MKSSSGEQTEGVMSAFGVLIVATLMLGPWPSVAVAASSGARTPEESARLKVWRATMAKTHLSKLGCFEATFPNPEWKSVPCQTAPEVEYSVGQGQNDYTASVTSSPPYVSLAAGAIESVSNVTSETGTLNGKAGVANVFSLQLNTNFSPTTACPTKSAKCHGWQQFIFDNGTGFLLIQYWLHDYGATCPTEPPGVKWHHPKSNSEDCLANGPNALQAAPITDIGDLSQLSVAGLAGANADAAILLNGEQAYAVVNEDDIVNLGSSAWTTAEFNVFGEGGGTEAVFNTSPVATIGISTTVFNGSLSDPSCVWQSFTKEYNNLSLVSGVTVTGGSISFTESASGSGAPPCTTTTVK